MTQIYTLQSARRPGLGWFSRTPKLYRLAEDGEWDLIPDRVRSHPRESRYQMGQLPKDTVLHRVVSPRLEVCKPVENDKKDAMLLAAVHSIIVANPAAAEVSNAYGQTPLHLACSGSQTSIRLAAAQLLVQHSPRVAMRAENNHGRTPLMLLILDNPWIAIKRNDRKTSTRRKRLIQAARDLCQSLTHADPLAWERPAHSGETALSMALQFCSNNVSTNSKHSPRLDTEWLGTLLQQHEPLSSEEETWC